MSPNGNVAPVASGLDQVRSAADGIGHNGRNAACHRLVDDQSPGLLAVRWQDEHVGGSIDGGQFALIDEAHGNQHEPTTPLQFVRSSASSSPEPANAIRPASSRQPCDSVQQVGRTLAADQLADEQDAPAAFRRGATAAAGGGERRRCRRSAARRTGARPARRSAADIRGSSARHRGSRRSVAADAERPAPWRAGPRCCAGCRAANRRAPAPARRARRHARTACQ